MSDPSPVIRYRAPPDLDSGARRTIANFIVFGPRIPTGVRIVVMADSLTTADVLADGTVHAPLMPWLHS